ncbi:PqqD family protein [Streptomyces sp. F001]|nr:PqqD family protein [Streptomyces sp. F001]
MAGQGAAVTAGAAGRVRLHELDSRPDGEEWIVGRMATGRFVALPGIGKRALDLLGQGLTTDEVTERLRAETGDDIDVREFVEALVDLGFVAEVDGREVASPAVPRPSLARIRPRHVRWTLSPAVPVLLGVLFATTLLARPDVSLNYRTLLWSSHGSAVIAFGAAAGWSLLLLHECAHLLTARATGVPGRIRLGTRLQFLVMQTDISGIELAPRRHRLTAYLAGIATNLAVAALAALAAGAVDGTAQRVLAALTLLALLPLPFQLMVFMRTDLYFVLQDLTRCRDLYGDGVAYAKYAARRVFRTRTKGEDPSRALPAHERRAVRVYSVVLVVGTTLCLAFLATVTLPADVTLFARAVAAGLGPGHSVWERLDAVAVVVTLGGVHVLWARTWWRNRARHRVP